MMLDELRRTPFIPRNGSFGDQLRHIFHTKKSIKHTNQQTPHARYKFVRHKQWLFVLEHFSNGPVIYIDSRNIMDQERVPFSAQLLYTMYLGMYCTFGHRGRFRTNDLVDRSMIDDCVLLSVIVDLEIFFQKNYFFVSEQSGYMSNNPTDTVTKPR
jgi:hypothetical protein